MQAPDAIMIRLRCCAMAFAVIAVGGCDNRFAADVGTGISVERGKRLVDQYQCGSCHAIPGIPAARGTAGPPLDAFGRRSYIAGHIPNKPELLAKWLVDPRAMIPSTTMPSMGVSPNDARDMAAYLHSLQ
jgi:cytochrome c